MGDSYDVIAASTRASLVLASSTEPSFGWEGKDLLGVVPKRKNGYRRTVDSGAGATRRPRGRLPRFSRPGRWSLPPRRAAGGQVCEPEEEVVDMARRR